MSCTTLLGVQRRDSDSQICGDLQPDYPSGSTPECPDSRPLCSFVNGLQGCCDEKGDCIYYEDCYEYDQHIASTASSYLQW